MTKGEALINRKKAVSAVKNVGKKIVNTAKKVVKTVVNTVKNVDRTAVNAVKQTAKTVRNAVTHTKTYQSVKNRVTSSGTYQKIVSKGSNFIRNILKSLKESAKKKTVVLVSHRVSTMNVADVVYEMENGRIS